MKLKKIAFYLYVFLLSISLMQCSSAEKSKLEEIAEKKLPKGDGKKEEFVDPVQAMVAEIEVIEGVQKFVYYKVDVENKWYEEGLLGYVFNDIEMKKKVAKFKVVKIQNKFSKGEILELYFPIKQSAIVFIEVDPRKVIK